MLQNKVTEYLKRNGFEAFNPKAVLFDMDGVIYDSMYNHSECWHKAMKKCGLEMTREEAYLWEGMRGEEVIQNLARQQWHRELTNEQAHEIYLVKSAIFSSLEPAKKMEGITELFQQIHSDGLNIGVVTGSGQKSLLDRLEEDFCGLIRRDLVVTSYDVRQGKPNPEPYLCGLIKNEVKANEAIVVENAPLGVRAAVNAGIFTIAVNTGPLSNEELIKEGADLVFNSMTDLCEYWINFRQFFL